MTDQLPLPVAEISHGRLRWHLPTPDADPVAKFLNNDTHPLYTADQMRAYAAAAVAAERALWTEAVMGELDGNGQALAIVAHVVEANTR
jgi:hypothetical protein